MSFDLLLLSSARHRLQAFIMADAASPDPNVDLLPVDNAEEEANAPAPAPAPEPKLLTRKDTSLKEFLSKMDDYAPIVSIQPAPQTYAI